MKDTEKDAILGALLWLRNHYDIGRESEKEKVLRRIDMMLEANEISFRHINAFQRFMQP